MSKILKIKDNINLTELEKFGFRKKSEKYYLSEEVVHYYEKAIRQRYHSIIYIINEDTRKIYINSGEDYEREYCEIDNTLYDLTKAGLIEVLINKED